MPRDATVADAFAAAAARYRLDIVDRRSFSLVASPERRELHNPLLLTGEADYDTVFIADSVGEYGPYLPYATLLPRPVLGTAGLVATAWHWAYERFGAPQVEGRFVRQSHRRMSAADWGAWMAVRAVVTAALETGTTDAASLGSFLLSEALELDGSKGVAMDFRAWDGQLRMPILLATDRTVIAAAPLEGFVHERNDLDTLGTDAPEHRC
jgi:ABC transporter substrate binding protein (PQQ-dependent alcohol dehydrogenase system)